MASGLSPPSEERTRSTRGANRGTFIHVTAFQPDQSLKLRLKPTSTPLPPQRGDNQSPLQATFLANAAMQRARAHCQDHKPQSGPSSCPCATNHCDPAWQLTAGEGPASARSSCKAGGGPATPGSDCMNLPRCGGPSLPATEYPQRHRLLLRFGSHPATFQECSLVTSFQNGPS